MPRHHYLVRIGDREHDVVVEVDDGAGSCRVEVDGHSCEVIEAGGAATVVRGEGAALQTVVALEPGASPRQAVVEGVRIELQVRTTRDAALDEALGARGPGSSGASTVVAPMPGRIVQVLVAPGDEIEAGAATIIMEAMKMENELRADAAGTVTSVGVSVGETVDAGQVLCEIASQATS